MTSPRDWCDALTDTLRHALRIEVAPQAAAAALRELPPAKRLALDEALRRAWWKPTLPGPHWPVFAPVPDDDIDAQLFCIGCHADGHMRERALRLSQTRDGVLPDALAAIRCDDWVAPVRACAEDALRLRLERDAGWPFDRIDLLLALSRRERFRNGAWRTLLVPALCAPTQADRRWSLLGHPHPRVRMFACRTIAQADPDRVAELADWALGRRDPVAALWAIRDLPALSAIEFDEALLALAWRSRFAPVRAQALRLWSARPDAAYIDRVRRALLDPSPSVRGVAAFAARTQGIDPRAVWRAAIAAASDSRPPGAVLALAEQPEAEDLALLRPSLDDASGDVRCAVLRGLLKAGIDDAVPVLRDALAAPQGKVVRLALTLGEHLPGFLTRDGLIEAHARAANARTQQIVLDAARRFGTWGWLYALLDFRLRRPEAIDVTTALISWCSHAAHRHTPLTPEGRDALLARVAAIAPLFPDQDWVAVRRAVEAAWILPTRSS